MESNLQSSKRSLSITSTEFLTLQNCVGGTYCKITPPFKGPSWSWSHSSWINYLYNQCLSPLRLWVRTPVMARRTRCNIMW